MDKFTLIIGLVGTILLVVSIVVIISAIINLIKKKTSLKKFISSFIIFLITFAFATSFIYLSLFLQTFSRYTSENQLGWVYAERDSGTTKVTFYNAAKDQYHWFNISGEQWMIEGYFLRWGLALRWLGAGSYYRVTRFTGRWSDPEKQIASVYQIQPETKLWRFLLMHGKKIPLIDAAYGIGAFQYPHEDTVDIFINDTGFILRIR
ncbi:MAG: hypothetical protein WBB37_06685 [bacterium]